MNKLDEILRELKEKGEGRKSSEDPFSESKNTGKSKRILFFILFFFLFTASILGGFILVKIITTFVGGKDLGKLHQPKVIPIVKEQNSPKLQDKNIGPLPLSNKTTDLNNTTDIREINNKTLDMEKIKNVNNKTTAIKKAKTREEDRKIKPSVEGREKVKTNLKDQKLTSSQRPIYKAIKEPKPKEEPNIPLKGISEEKTPLLKEKKLIENLLLNAEEARARGNIEEAINFYTAYLKYREDPDVLNNLAGLYMLRGEFKIAERLLERALSIKQDEIYKINLIINLWEQGEKERACQYLNEKQFSPHLNNSLKEFKKYCK